MTVAFVNTSSQQMHAFVEHASVFNRLIGVRNYEGNFVYDIKRIYSNHVTYSEVFLISNKQENITSYPLVVLGINGETHGCRVVNGLYGNH